MIRESCRLLLSLLESLFVLFWVPGKHPADLRLREDTRGQVMLVIVLIIIIIILIVLLFFALGYILGS